jgi:dUTP pyrophosphatase
MTTLRFAKLNKLAKTPVRKHPTDAGVDVFALGDFEVLAHSWTRVHTGLTFEIGPGFMLLAMPKSGTNYVLGAGVLDPGYQGEILIKVINYTDDDIHIHDGDAVAQLVQVPILTDPLEEVPLGEIHQVVSDRGTDGGIVRQK